MGKSKHYNWQDLSSPPVLDHHSLAKHEVIQEYLSNYFDVRCANPAMDWARIAFVDGFAGGGFYRDPNDHSRFIDGSPLRIIRAVQEAEKRLQATRTKPFKILAKYYFVEKDKNAVNALRYWLNQSDEIPHDDIQIIHNKFDKAIPSIIQDISKGKSKTPKSFFLLDQYGYKDASPKNIRPIFQHFPFNAEVLLTFDTDDLVNHLADTQACFTSMNRNELSEFYETVRGQQIADIPANRLFIEQVLHREMSKNYGATYFTPFFITSRSSNKSYWLVHLSNHPKARDVMTNVHWSKKNHSLHYGGAGLNMMVGYDPKRDFGSQNSLEFSFDDQFEIINHQALTENLMQHVSHNPIRFDSVFSSTCNNSPATLDQYKKAIFDLNCHKEVEIISPCGGTRKVWNSISLEDRLIRPQQKSFLFKN